MIEAAKLRRYAADPLRFIADLTVTSAHGPRRFGDIMAPYQADWFGAIAPSLVAVASGERPPIGRFFVERTKGSSKDSDVALCLLWLITFSRQPLDVQIGASDRDQADEPRSILRDVLRLNPWLAERVEIQSWKVLCEATGSTIDILAADTAGSHGSRPDVVFLNELSHLPDGKQDFALTLLDNASKRPRGLVIVATNAGYLGTWQHEFREMARESDRWHFSAWSQPAPYMDAAELSEVEKRNPRTRTQRLYWGVWSAGGEFALDPDDIDAAQTLDHMDPLPKPELAYGVGLDLGVKRDHCGLVCLGACWRTRRVRVAYAQSWAPLGGQVDLIEVRNVTAQIARQYGAAVHFDPWQAALLAQELTANGIQCVEVPFAGQNLQRMASAMLQAFRERRIDLWPDAKLIDDLGRLSIVERPPFGYKLAAGKSASSGHADLAFALACVMPFALDFAMTTTGDSNAEPLFDYVHA